MPYLAHIKSLTPSWKTLKYLADWMEVGTTPLRWKEIHKTPNHFERIQRTKLAYIEYESATASTTLEINTSGALKELLRSLSHDPQKERPQRLFIVEDLSRQVIEILGARFDIDPMFFREHIDDYVWHNVRDPWAQPRSLMSNMKHRQWFQMRNMRLRYYKTRDEFKQAWIDANKWNVLRRPEDDVNHWKFADIEDSIVAIMRTRTTLWIGKDKQCGDATVGILLVDPTTPQGQPLWYDRTNWLPIPKMNDPPVPVARMSDSWYKDIVNMTETFPWFEQGGSLHNNPQVLAKPALYTICAEWLVVCDYVKTRLSQIERELEMPRLFRSKGDAIDTSLSRLHTWRRQIPIFREMVTETLEHAVPAAARLAASPSMPFTGPNSPLSTRSIMTDTGVINFDDLTGYEDIVPDFRRVLAAINVLQERVDRLTGIVTSEIGIEDSRRGLKENHNMARLSWLATVFIPLSFISSMYSMNEDITALKSTYGWYFLTSIPFTLLVMLAGWMIGTESWTPWRDNEHGGIFGGKDVKKKKERKKKEKNTELH
jgi:Mg2+ and Co2+ transporter CorA